VALRIEVLGVVALKIGGLKGCPVGLEKWKNCVIFLK